MRKHIAIVGSVFACDHRQITIKVNQLTSIAVVTLVDLS